MAREDERDPAARALARVDPRWDAAHTERALAGLHRRAARRRATTALGALTLVALGTWTAWTGTHDTTPHVVAGLPSTVDHVVHLADGSEVVPDEGAEVVVQHVSDARIAVRIDRGGADVEVVPGLARRFEVHAGAVTVTVIGTAFRVERLDDTRARVAVTRGHVDVAWAGGHADLVAGDEGVFPTASEEVVATAEATAELAVAEPPPAHDAPARDPAPRASPSTPAHAWRELARAERYDEAYSALGTPAESAASVRDDVDDLLLAADVARLSGHPVQALPWLESVLRDHRTDARAVLAAFTRGRILMDLGRSADAAEQLEAVLAMEPSGSLAEDALARAALAHAAAGHAETASALAQRYRASYPTGRWSGRVRSLAEDTTPR